ncbi:L-lysine exporter family protein LysE/ArgO [Pseudomonas sp. ok272]|uniref:LysE family translocator n=1 Tax=unclassified Pseudomonas TaxID=196821 RepID=UPI0008B5D180|nr:MULTISPECIES: LysE family translocator [unclassified Pseudomonas]SEN38198.1 L-lysine exporter family protein LysE/ArgO [Pseudomonas sp. ok272]SFN22369.1 L-lysine exporter family protein LysE/ArgO [Pseudomonas sp. ok602]
MEFSSGFLLSLSLCLDIGVANIAMITLAMQRGYFQGFSLGLGTCVGDLIYAVLALAGMTVLLQYSAVRWVLWVGGSALLLYFAAKMIYSAIHHSAVLAPAGEAVGGSRRREFFRGIFLAMSSPSAILWFAAVGGTLIARSGGGSLVSAGLFLAGFFCAGLLWCAALCLAATQGGKLLGDKLLRYSYLASAAIFCYFAVYVILSGYQEFIVGAAVAELPGL